MIKRKFLKNMIFIFIFLFIFIGNNTYALETKIYRNKNEVKLMKKEYNFVNDFYGTSYFQNMTKEDYEWLAELNIENNMVTINTVYDNNLSISKRFSTYDSQYKTSNKRLSIAKSCDSKKCTILTNLTWLTNPNVRSNDVIGARFDGTSLYTNTITTKISSSDGTTYYSNTKTLSNGIGTSVKLPNEATNIVAEQKFFTNLGGKIYASYQHATSNISLANSYYYTISSNGYGKVFNFFGHATGVYDGMNGVDI